MMTNARPVVLACDIGSSGLRAGLLDAKGNTRAHVRNANTAVSDPDENGFAEFDVNRWWNALGESVASLEQQAPKDFAQIVAITITGMTRTQVLVDKNLKPLHPAFLWSDTRAERTLGLLKSKMTSSHPEWTNMNAFHPLARMHWLHQSHPEIAAKVAVVLEPKDYLGSELTGIAASDPISMARLSGAAVPHDGRSLFEALSIDASSVPPLMRPTSIVGRVRSGLTGPLAKLNGTPVVMTSHDTWTSVVGLGALRSDFAYNLSGTTEVFGLITDQAATADGLLSVHWSEGLTQIGGPSLAGGDTLQWLVQTIAKDRPHPLGEVLDRMLSQPRSPRPLLFLPHLQGERVPYWDPNLRGAWLGLSRDHAPSDLANSVLEGVAFLNRLVLERAERATGTAVREIRFGGGGAASDYWCQIKADITGRTVVTTANEEHGLVGAAVAAWTALGEWPSLTDAQEAVAAPHQRFEPNAKRHAGLTKLFKLYQEAEAAVAPISRALAAIQQFES